VLAQHAIPPLRLAGLLMRSAANFLGAKKQDRTISYVAAKIITEYLREKKLIK
jgi:hypothetical protein